MLLHKQTSNIYTWSTELDFKPLTANEETGTGAYRTCFAYAALVVHRDPIDDGRTSRSSGDISTRTKWRQVASHDNPKLILSSRRSDMSYRLLVLPPYRSGHEAPFAYKLSGSDAFVEIGMVSSQVLLHERQLNSPCTGAMFAVFAHGREGYPCEGRAYFSYVKLEHHDLKL